MIPVNYHHLYYFWTTAKCGSVSSAAEELFLTQPALSSQIAQLEKSLGKKLFQRGRRGVSLTPAGKIAFSHCERIFESGEALLKSVKGGASDKSRSLRLGVAESAPKEVALKLLSAAGQDGVQPALFSGTAQELAARLERHSLDIAVCDEDVSSSLGRGFRCKTAGDSPLAFVAAPKLGKALGRFPSRARIVPMLLRSPNNPLRWEVERFLRVRSAQFSTTAETDDPELIRILAVAGKGVAALSLSSIKEDLAAGRLLDLHGKPTGIKQRFWICASAHPHPDALVHKVREKILSGFAV